MRYIAPCLWKCERLYGIWLLSSHKFYILCRSDTANSNMLSSNLSLSSIFFSNLLVYNNNLTTVQLYTTSCYIFIQL